MQNHGTEQCALYNYGTTAHINFDDELNGKNDDEQLSLVASFFYMGYNILHGS